MVLEHGLNKQQKRAYFKNQILNRFSNAIDECIEFSLNNSSETRIEMNEQQVKCTKMILERILSEVRSDAPEDLTSYLINIDRDFAIDTLTKSSILEFRFGRTYLIPRSILRIIQHS